MNSGEKNIWDVKDLESWEKLAIEMYKEINFDENAPTKIVESLKNNGIVNILGYIHALRKSKIEKKETALLNFLNIISSKFRDTLIIIVNKEIDASNPLNSVKRFKISDAMKVIQNINDLLHKRAFLIVTKHFWEGLNAISSIFDAIWDDGSKIIPVLAWDRKGIFWELVEGELLIISKFTPSVRLFFPFFHAFRYYPSKIIGLKKLDELIRSKGLLSRSWGKPRWVINKIKKMVSEIDQYKNTETFIYLLSLLLDGKLLVEDIYAYMVYLIKGSKTEDKIKYLFENGVIPSDNLVDILEKTNNIDINTCLGEILNSLKKAESIWFPEISIVEILDLPYGVHYDKKILHEWIEKKFQLLQETSIENFVKKEKIPVELLPLLKFSIILMSSRIKPKSEVTSLIIRYILSLYNRIKYMAIPIISNVLTALQVLSDIEIGLAVFLQRFLEVHGPRPYLILMEKIFGDKQIFASYIGILINSNQGIGPRKILAKAITSETIIRSINKYLVAIEGIPPRGFTTPLIWELNTRFSKNMLRAIKASIDYFLELDIKPPRPLEILESITEKETMIEKSALNLENLDISKVIAATVEITKLKGEIDELKMFLFENFGRYDTRLIRAIDAKTNEVSRKIEKTFERKFVNEYGEMLKKERFVAEAIQEAIKIISEDKPLILFVIDGLRIDDYISKIKPQLDENGLMPVKESYLLSFLPSITTYSRRSIFSGEKPPKVLGFPFKTIGFRLKSEEEYLKDRFGNILYIRGSLGEINSRVKNMYYTDKLKGLKVMAFVISDLEKAAHGSAEGFLAHLTYDYASEVVKTIRNVVEAYFEINRVVPYVLLISDHGLEKFTKVTDFQPQEIVKICRKEGMLDPVHDELITPRYMILPLTSQEKAKILKLKLPKNIKENIWILSGSELKLEKVAMKVKNEDFLEPVKAERIVFVFPRGNKRFKYGPARSVVYHGGALPSEVLVPFVLITAK